MNEKRHLSDRKSDSVLQAEAAGRVPNKLNSRLLRHNSKVHNQPEAVTREIRPTVGKWPKLADRIRRRTVLADAILAHAAENH